MAILRKIKEKLSAITKKSVKKQKEVVGKVTKKTPVSEMKKEIFGEHVTAVEQSKYSHPESHRARRPMPQDLPYQYGKDRIVLMVRDPWWLHTYWEVTGPTYDRLKNDLKDDFYKAKRLLRVYDVTNIIFNGSNAHRHFDVYVSEQTTNWYIDTAGPGRSWCVDYGLLLPDGRFITIVRSNTVGTPIDGPSWITDEEWMIPEEMFARLYGMGFGLGQSSPVGKAWQERVKQALFSGVLASPGMASMASPVKKGEKERKFWFVLDCELIVYGATEPDAKVTVQGKEIKLRPDGSFTLRYALPDGKQVIPVKAVSSDEVEERTITPIVSRETKSTNLAKEFSKEI
ncbi:MAG: DUF4912 domain-containing protein [Candidatus Omnitrophica bacterium]|nr:DUF4912 domain-containing protein [Candidatus Omnitrophota bacterium]